ncbi:MAG TPA: ABC transporter permease [Ohtaekwangia sp.]|nr:ABC transporter permease [Ohtaekwangia sp.]
MIRNYFQTAFRNLTKNLNYTLINLIGLVVGLACCFLIGLYVRFELSYESFHENKNQIYRFIPRSAKLGELSMQTYTPAGLAPFVKATFPEVEAFTRFVVFDYRPFFKNGNQALAPEAFALADSAFFKIFSFELTQGDPYSALSRPLTMVISESVARKFFPGQNPLGKVIDYNQGISLEITGVFKDIPENTHLKFSYLASFVSLPILMDKVYAYKNDALLDDFGASNYASYFLVRHGDIHDLQGRISKSLYEHTMKMFPTNNYSEDWLQPLPAVHFTKGIKGDPGGTGSLSYVYIFSAVAVFILLIACFNFVNLNTALALRRAKEVGLRKALGALKSQLVFQFIGETFLLVLIAIILAFQVVELALPAFNSLMGMEISLVIWSDSVFLTGVLITGLVTALLAGSYPAFYLSSFDASKVLKGNVSNSGRSGLRKALTIAQFGIATFMITCTILVYEQMRYMKHADVGFEKEHVISFPITPKLHAEFDTFKERLLQYNGIQAVSLCGGLPGQTLSHWRYKFPDGEHDETSINTVAMDYDYLDVVGVQLVAGRKLSREFSTDDSLAYLINETAAREFLLEKPVGTTFQVLDGQHPPGKIVGVVKDYHFRSLQHKIDPLVLRIEPGNSMFAAVKLSEGDIQDKVKFIHGVWKTFLPDYTFDYSFLDESYDRLYKAEEKTSVLMTVFSCLAVLIACLGLLGLTSFLTQQRRREISIRKVHGAGVNDVIALLSLNFLKLVGIGFCLMAPLAWYVGKKWLESFAYKTSISPWIFLFTAVLLFVLALITVSYQSYRASLSNPADVLKEH